MSTNSIGFNHLKIYTLILSLFTITAQAEPYLPPGTRLAMGYYYPSLSIVSNKTDIQISLNYWIEELTKSVGMDNVYSVLYDDINKMNQDFEKGVLDLIVAPPLLVATVFDRKLLIDGFIGVNSIDNIDNLLIIARQEIDTPFGGYKGKRLLLPNNDLLAKIFLETEVLEQYNRSLQQVFSKINYSNKSQRMVLDLFFDKTDIAIVYESALNVILELNPQLEKRIKILKKFPIKGRNFGYFHRNFVYQKKLHEGLKMFNEQPRGKQILQVFHTSTVAICKVSYLDRLDDLYNKHLQLKNKLKND